MFSWGTLFAGETNPFDKVSQKEKEKLKNTTTKERIFEIHDLMVFSINGGLSNMAKMTGSNLIVDDENFSENLSSGLTFGLEYHRYMKEKLGFGIAFNYYTSAASIKVMNDSGQISKLSNKVKIPTLSLAGGFKKANAEKLLMYGADLRIGGAIYQEELSVFNGSADYSCPAIIFGTNIFIEYLINKTTGLGFSCSGTLGSISELFAKGGSHMKLDKPLSLNRIDLLLSLKFHFNT